MTKQVLIDEEELKRASSFLECLRAAGVDNWDGYEYAQEMFSETEEDDD